MVNLPLTLQHAEHVKYFKLLDIVRMASERDDLEEIRNVMGPYLNDAHDLAECVREMTNKYLELRSEVDRLLQDIRKEC